MSEVFHTSARAASGPPENENPAALAGACGANSKNHYAIYNSPNIRSPQAVALRNLSELIEQSALQIRVAAMRAGFSDKAAWRAADVVGMGSMLALGGNPAEAYEFAVSDLFEPEERRDITEADFPAVDRHLTALRGYLKRLPPDDGWRTRPKHKFVDWPEHARPKFRLRSWEGLING